MVSLWNENLNIYNQQIEIHDFIGSYLFLYSLKNILLQVDLSYLCSSKLCATAAFIFFSLFVSESVSLKTGFLFIYNLVQFLGFSWIFVNMTVRLFIFGQGEDLDEERIP